MARRTIKSDTPRWFWTEDEYRAWWAMSTDSPYGKCWCGCGASVPVAIHSDVRKGCIRGLPRRFVSGHNSRLRKEGTGPRWNGGRIYDSSGYVFVYSPWHPFAENKGYVREHRLIMEDKLGRLLWPWEIVHHINGTRWDNRAENLELTDHARHRARHGAMSADEVRAVRQLRTEGMTYERIARRVGRSMMGVWKVANGPHFTDGERKTREWLGER